MTRKENLKHNNSVKLTRETFNPDNFCFVDLGLPSGTLWADQDAPGYYQFDEAVETFGSHLPKAWMLVELWEECGWTWNKERNGYDIVGPNGNFIFAPAAGWMDYDGNTDELTGALTNVGSIGYWWSCAPNSRAYARYLYFNSGAVTPLSYNGRANGLAVRPSRESI